jgi:hypothetical protein
MFMAVGFQTQCSFTFNFFDVQDQRPDVRGADAYGKERGERVRRSMVVVRAALTLLEQLASLYMPVWGQQLAVGMPEATTHMPA